MPKEKEAAEKGEYDDEEYYYEQEYYAEETPEGYEN